jgi:hypothetical protein
VSSAVDLYGLMPAIYRREDAGLGFPLEALLEVISTQAGHLQRDISDLWDDFFVETAAEWVVPYIADLVGTTPLHPVAGSVRADVANTIFYRRRKGTVAMLEAMASDVTGWGVRVVPFFELLEWAQHLDHLRLPRRATGPSLPHEPRLEHHGVGTVDLTDRDALDLLSGPFDRIAHSVDVRPVGPGTGGRNLGQIGFFVWRLQSNPLHAVDARRSPGHDGYHVSPLGDRAPLFTNDERPPGTIRPTEADLPGPIRPLALRNDLARAATADPPGATSRYYGPDPHHSLAVAIGDPAGRFADDTVPAAQVVVCNLADWRRPPAEATVAVDPGRGRLTLAADAEPQAGQVVRVSYCYGASGGVGGDIGGGPYDRRASLAPPRPEDTYVVVVRVQPDDTDAGDPPTPVTNAIGAALTEVAPAGRAIVEVPDSATYSEEIPVLELPAGVTLELRAATGHRPVLELTGAAGLTVQGATTGADATAVVDGLALLGGPVVIGSDIRAVHLRHTTLVPGRSFDAEGQPVSPTLPSVQAAAGAGDCDVVVSDSIVGPIRLPAEGFALRVRDSVVDAPAGTKALGGPIGGVGGPGPATSLERVTVLGDVDLRSLDRASEVLFTGPVTCERTQAGCVRFSFVPEGSTTPVHYRCQPDMALEGVTGAGAQQRIVSRLQPRFTSRRYGEPGYAQLAEDAAAELRTGAEDEAEMGAFNRLRNAQRLANLRIRLDEYLPAGLTAGVIHVT